jgi:hypothetical protein
MGESETRYLDAILTDVEPLLGPGVVVESIEREDDEALCCLSLRYRLGSAAGTSQGVGESVVAAHAALREAVIEDRIGLSLRALVRG